MCVCLCVVQQMKTVSGATFFSAFFDRIYCTMRPNCVLFKRETSLAASNPVGLKGLFFPGEIVFISSYMCLVYTLVIFIVKTAETLASK